MSSAPPEKRDGCIVLGSRSPRRKELLSLIVPPHRIIVRPPADPTEPGFEAAQTKEEIAAQLRRIARAKNHDVTAQLDQEGTRSQTAAIVTADTVIVATDENGEPVVLGQPPEDESWRETVRDWFERYLLKRPHAVMTAVCISTPDGRRRENLVQTHVAFRPDTHQWLEWYLQTGEPRAKAGGYALQGAGSLFVESVQDSPSNVIGLPLRETAEMLQELRVT